MYHDPKPSSKPVTFSDPARLTVGKDGRILIPAAMREAAGFTPGATVVARVKGGRIVLEEFMHGIRRAQSLAAKYRQSSGSVVDELIADRRAEAAKEEEEMREMEAREKARR